MTAAIDITTGQRKMLLALLRRFVPGVAVWAYGSRVKWTARPDSDLDLVAFTTPDQRRRVPELKEALDESNLPFLVDVHVWNEVPECFHDIIRKEYVVLQEAERSKKGSGVAGGWRSITAQDFCASVRDGTHDSPKPVENGRFLVTSRHIIGGHLDLGNAYLISEDDFYAINKRSKVDRWDVLISMIGTVGEPCLIKEEPDFAIKNIGLFKSKSEVEGKWLYYYIRNPDTQQLIREQSRGTTQEYIPLGALREFPILAPTDKNEMRAITHILGMLDDKIELNRRMSETLEAMARALFKSWFVDFDPVRAKAEGRDPGLPQPLADLFPDSFEDSELGEIPKGWRVMKIGEFIERLPVGQKYEQKTVSPAGKVPVLDQGKLGVIGFHNNEPGVTGTLDKPIVVFTNHTCYMRLITYSFFAIQNVLPFVGSGVDTFWAYYATEGRLSFSEYKGHWPDFVIQESVVPLRELTDAFGRLAKPLLSQIRNNEEQSRTLAALRDALLPNLISGELRVKDAERFIGRVS